MFLFSIARQQGYICKMAAETTNLVLLQIILK